MSDHLIAEANRHAKALPKMKKSTKQTTENRELKRTIEQLRARNIQLRDTLLRATGSLGLMISGAKHRVDAQTMENYSRADQLLRNT